MGSGSIPRAKCADSKQNTHLGLETSSLGPFQDGTGTALVGCGPIARSHHHRPNHVCSVSHRNYFFDPAYWLLALKEPGKAAQNIYATARYPRLRRISKNVEGLISLHLGCALYEMVRRADHPSRNVVEVGAFKGLSTVYLSLAAAEAGRRVKSFELFTGLPPTDAELDPAFAEGQFASDQAEYERHVREYGRREVVDLTVGDARESIIDELGDDGFAVAFIDVDLYDVTRDLLELLTPTTTGGEVVVLHDAWSPGVRRAIDEFRERHPHVRESCPEKGAAALHF